jgi:hypothetical protein
MPPPGSRIMYLIIHDAQILQADPLRVLAERIIGPEHHVFRLSDAKLLTSESECLKGLPTAAVDRFLELVGMYEVPRGKHIKQLHDAKTSR